MESEKRASLKTLEDMRRIVIYGEPKKKVGALQRMIGEGREEALETIRELGSHDDQLVRGAVVKVLLMKGTHAHIPVGEALNALDEIVKRERDGSVLKIARTGLESHIASGELDEETRRRMEDILKNVKKKLGVME